MISKIAPIVVFVSLLLVNRCSNEKTQRQEDRSAKGAPARNLDVYDKAGPFDAGLSMEKVSFIEEKRREFLWEHWRQQKLGYIATTLYTKEGDKITLHEYVEPDDGGKWHISVRLEKLLVDRELWARTKENRTYPEEETYKIYFLERIDPTKRGAMRQKNIPPEQERSPASYMLRLKDEEGKLIGDL
jgi:hypothetical protein